MIPCSLVHSDVKTRNTDATFRNFVKLQAAMMSFNDIGDYLTV